MPPDDNLTDQKSSGPLSGITILDLTIAMAGPLATQRLADMGANVIKIEAPNGGDFTRLNLISGAKHNGNATGFLAMNRNKRSICIDLKSPEGLAVFMELVAQADVVVQNFRPNVPKRLQIDYESVARTNPAIIYVSISGYGGDEALRDVPGQDLLVQAYSGMMYSGGAKDERPQASPVYLIDTCASHLATEAVLAALLDRLRHGAGQHVQISMLAAAFEMQIQEISTMLSTGTRPRRSGQPAASVWLKPPYGVYRTKDRYIALAQCDLTLLGQLLGQEQLSLLAGQEPEWGSPEFYAWRDAVCILVDEAVGKQETEPLLRRLSAAGIWCAPVLDLDEAIESPAGQALLATVTSGNGEAMHTVAPTISFGNYVDLPMRYPPKLGAHSREVLGELGYGDTQIDALMDWGVIK